MSELPKDAELERFVRGLTCPKEPCRPDPEFPESAYSGPLARARAAALARGLAVREEERAQVERVLERVQAAPDPITGLGRLKIEEVGGLHRRLWVEILLRCSFAERYRHPQRMLELAEMARDQAEALEEESYGPALVADERARAWAELANAYRVNDDLNAGEKALLRAFELLSEGSGDPLVAARVGDLTASLYADQSRFEDAFAALDRVIGIYQRVGDLHLAGKALIQKGIFTRQSGDAAGALTYLQAGMARLDPARDPQLAASAGQSLIAAQVDRGDYNLAARTLLKSGLREAFAEEPLNRVKVRWLEGQILAGLGNFPRAAAAFAEARIGFLSHGKDYDAALAGLDLAAIWLELGHPAEVKGLAQDVFFTLEDLGIQREARRAAQYLYQACEKQQATPGLIRHVSRFLQRLEIEPHLRFEAV